MNGVKTALLLGVLTAIILATFGPAASGSDAAPFAGADVFIQQNCTACHNSANGLSNTPGRLDLTNLSYEPANADNFSTWVKPEEIAAVVLDILSDRWGIVSGAAIPVYGLA